MQSIQFHENGKRHKLAVSKKLTDIGRKSIQDEKERKKIDLQMKQMEDAALKAYANDISRGGDMTTQSLNAMVAAASANFGECSVNATQSVPGPSALPRHAIDPMLPPLDVMDEEEREKREKMKRKQGPNDIIEPSLWVEAKSDDGHTYYWNVKTNDSVWKAPKEGYMTIEEYNRLNLVFEAKQEQKMHEQSKFMRDNADELAAKYKREKLKALKQKPTEKEIKEEEKKRESYEPYESETEARAIGSWQTIVKK